MRQFLFLYPIAEYFEAEFQVKLRDLGRTDMIIRYFSALNSCVSKRYRAGGFEINWAVFDGHSIAPEIRTKESDRIVEVGLNYATHTNQKVYPSNDLIIDRVLANKTEPVEHLRLAGFHIWDCVEKLAQRVHERKIDVLIDEDLTDFLAGLIRFGPKFRRDTFPSHNPRDAPQRDFEMWFEARKGKPYFWQDY